MWDPGLGNPRFLSDRTEMRGWNGTSPEEVMPAARRRLTLYKGAVLYYRLADLDPLEY
jgi:hypothetical protein